MTVWVLSFHDANLPTSEGDDLDFWVSDDALSNHAAVAKHHVDHPGGETDVLDDLAEHPGSDARHLAGFTNHGVTWGKLLVKYQPIRTQYLDGW